MIIIKLIIGILDHCTRHLMTHFTNQCRHSKLYHNHNTMLISQHTCTYLTEITRLLISHLNISDWYSLTS